MVSKIKCLFLLLCITGLHAYGQQLVCYVSLNTDNAYIGQPVQMTVSVYTSTWFTAGVDVGNIHVDGALTVYFRSVSNSKQFGGKPFSGVDLIYSLFPTKAGEIIVPPISITVETPKEGGFQGIKHIIETKEKRLTAKDVPLGYDPNNWLVSSSLDVTQKWSTSLNGIKVGDVLQRTITRRGAGTLSEFIPAIYWDSVPGISIYPKRPIMQTDKSRMGVSAFRSETANYLFEHEGQVVIPRMEFLYWNIGTRKFYKKVIDSVVVHVAHNPDLKVLTSIKKQLAAETTAEKSEEKPNLILGLTPKAFAEALIVLGFAVFLLYKLVKWLITYFKRKRAAYHQSEPYAFNKMVKTLRRKDARAFLNACKIWSLQLELGDKGFHYFLSCFGTDKLKDQYTELNNELFNPAKSRGQCDYAELLKGLRSSRKTFLKNRNKAVEKNIGWLNPVS